jgi:hypothetical protein
MSIKATASPVCTSPRRSPLLVQRPVARRRGRPRIQSPVLWHLAGGDHQRTHSAQRAVGRCRVMKRFQPQRRRFPGNRAGAMASWACPWHLWLLPLYVMLPNHYARNFGARWPRWVLLLGARLFDAFIDPLLGRWSDRLFKQSTDTVLRWAAAAALALGAGFALLFFPQVSASSALMVWLVVSWRGRMWPTAPCRYCTSPGVHAWVATRSSAAGSWPGVRGWGWQA